MRKSRTAAVSRPRGTARPSARRVKVPGLIVPGLVSPAASIEVRTYSGALRADMKRLVNATISRWPYSRPIDEELIAHWHTLGDAFQPENMLFAFRAGRLRAFLHGERERDVHAIRFLAIAPGAVPEAVALIEAAEKTALAEGAKRLVGPEYRSTKFYGGYILGLEPYHPHWYVDATEAFVRTGFTITQNECILVCTRETAAKPGSPPAGYAIVEAETKSEFLARAFRYAAVSAGKNVATCGARLYPKLTGSDGRPIGQIGYVGTDEAHRGKGLATLMTEMCLKRLFRMGAGEVLISTGLDNPSALRAYEKAGFRRRHSVTEWTKALAR